MTAVEALAYLRARLVEIEAFDSRHRPHWTATDLEAVDRLLERPAANEQIALARIEGIASQMDGYSAQAAKLVRAIARAALGLRALS